LSLQLAAATLLATLSILGSAQAAFISGHTGDSDPTAGGFGSVIQLMASVSYLKFCVDGDIHGITSASIGCTVS